MTRKGHCQLENRESNLGVSHVFLSIPPLLMASLRNRPREAPGLVQNCSVKGGLCQPWGVYPHQDHPLPKPCPSRPVSPRGPGSVAQQ